MSKFPRHYQIAVAAYWNSYCCANINHQLMRLSSLYTFSLIVILQSVAIGMESHWVV
nr:hypothetical protein OEHFJDOB_00258 [Klebsiella pneumoniae]UQW93956.1 hypothetical protein OKNFBMNL_00103 [Klebsiella quasipneumoniae subsp. quasipneumoniae]UQW94238.1 hypothetical protein PCIJMNHK_00007 [Klebsiella variicola]